MLRKWRPDDVDVVYAACQDAEIHRWMTVIPRPYTREDARAFVMDELGYGPHQFAIISEAEVVGSIGMGVNDNRTGRIGYWCAREARGRGFTTRALRLLCRYGFDELELARLELFADPENLASHRVAAKVGFQREGLLRSHLQHPDGHRLDSVLFSLLPGELR